MDASYFYNRMLGHREEYLSSGKYYYGYENGMCTIHHKYNESEWFVVFSDGDVWKETIGENEKRGLTIDDLKGDDFELFNNVQIIKSGYIVMETENEQQVKQVISRLHHYIAAFDDVDDPLSETKKDIPYLCGASMWSNGLTDEFSYYAVNGIELEIMTLRNLCKENVNRKYYDLRCIPFIKSMKNETSIYVKFVDIITDYKPRNKRCDQALTDLRSYLKKIDVVHKWVDCKMKAPVYC